MSTGDPEVPFAASGEQVRQREFATVRRGYDPAQVRDYLAMLAAHVETLERTLADAQARLRQIEDAAPPPNADADPYEQISRRFASVLSSADIEADRVVDHARAEAERIKDEAQASAEEARIRASQALINAREESDRMLANLAERRETMLSQLHEMQSRLLAMAQDLEGKNQPSLRRRGRVPPRPRTGRPSTTLPWRTSGSLPRLRRRSRARRRRHRMTPRRRRPTTSGSKGCSTHRPTVMYPSRLWNSPISVRSSSISTSPRPNARRPRGRSQDPLG